MLGPPVRLDGNGANGRRKNLGLLVLCVAKARAVVITTARKWISFRSYQYSTRVCSTSLYL